MNLRLVRYLAYVIMRNKWLDDKTAQFPRGFAHLNW